MTHLILSHTAHVKLHMLGLMLPFKDNKTFLLKYIV